jgi:AcrR family transcriptional regulator
LDRVTSAVAKDKLSRKERELEFRMNFVLDAAEEVFNEHSYANASVEEIAHRAEISVGTLYNLFHSKEEIYRAVVSRGQKMFFENMNLRVDNARGPLEQIRATVKYFFEHFTAIAGAFRHYNTATNGFQWELKSQLEQEAFEMQQQFAMRLVDICQRGIDEGIFKGGVPAELMATTVLGIPHSFLMVWLEQEGVDLMSLEPACLALTDRVVGAAND